MIKTKDENIDYQISWKNEKLVARKALQTVVTQRWHLLEAPEINRFLVR